MANKLYAMEQLTEEVAKDIAAKPEEWMRFLDTASRLYKYTFDEQLLIFAQRPEATAVASMEVWNKRMYRWIRKGSKGIALIDYTSSPKTACGMCLIFPDTYKVRNLGKDPALWVLPQDDRFCGRLSAESVWIGRRRWRACRNPASGSTGKCAGVASGCV